MIVNDEKELFKIVRDYAAKNYEKDGWDVIYEAYDDDQLREVLKGTRSVEVAIKRAHEAAKLHADQRSDVWGAGGLCTKCGSVDHTKQNCPEAH